MVEHEVAEAGERELAVLENSPAGHFDLILLDVQMPKASGWDLLLELRERSHEVAVIFVSGLDSTEALAPRLDKIKTLTA